MSKKKQRKVSAQETPAKGTPGAQTPGTQTAPRRPVSRVPRSRPFPVDSVEIARPGRDDAPFAGGAARLSVYSEWLNSPPPEIPAWLTGATEPAIAAIAPSAPPPAGAAAPARARKPSTRRRASAPAPDDAVTNERGATPSRDLGTSPESPALPRARTRRSTAARRLTAAERQAVGSLSAGQNAAATAAATVQAPVPAVPAGAYAGAARPAASAQAAPAAPYAATPATPQPVSAARRAAGPLGQPGHGPAQVPGTMPHPMPALAPLGPLAAQSHAGFDLSGQHSAPAPGSRATAVHVPDGRAKMPTPAQASVPPPQSAPAMRTSNDSDSWLLGQGPIPPTARTPSARASAFLTEEPAASVSRVYAAMHNGAAPGSGQGTAAPSRAEERPEVRSGTPPPATLGQTASRIAIPRSGSSPRLPAALVATGGRLPAVRQSQPVALAGDGGAAQEVGPAVLIHGARNPQPTSPVVPRRTKPHSVLAQALVAVVCVGVLLAALTITSPLGYGAALSGTFQSYANSVAWVPTATPTPQPPVYVSSSGSGNIAPPSPAQQVVINEIVAVFGSNANNALAIARCESGYDASARNPYAVGDSHAEGVFQILYPATWDTTSYSGDNPYDYVANIHAAFQIFQRDGYSWREWQCQP